MMDIFFFIEYKSTHSVINSGHVSLVQFLLQAGARTDVTNLQGKTVLDLAAFVGQNSASRIIRNYISLSDVEYYSVPQGGSLSE